MGTVYKIEVFLRSAAAAAAVLVICLFLFPVICEAADVDLEKRVNDSLAQAKVIVNAINAKRVQGVSVEAELSRLRKTAEDITANNLLLEERFRLSEEKAKALGAMAVDRHRAMVEGYRAALSEYLAIIDGLPHDGTIPQSAVRNLQSLLDILLPKKKRPIIGTLPYKHLNYPAQTPDAAPAITPAYEGGNKTVSSADTASSDEAPISNEIAALAQGLNWSPVSIYEYVKNNVETEWYRGCMKGAEETFRQKSGNDCDQATLLAALLRASGFPARYVRGMIEFFPDIERAKNLTGIDDPAKIAEFFQKAGIPYTPVIAGGKISNLQFEHIWVESQIPYANYRGVVIDASGKVWLGLDTSIKVKGYTYNSAPDIHQEPGVSSRLSTIRDEYLGLSSSGTGSLPFELNQTPLEYLQDSINSELRTLNFELSFSDCLRSRTLIPEVLNILPASMQFTLVKATNEYAAIPDELIHKVRFTVANSQLATGEELFTVTLPLYRLSNQSLAMSYEPESVQDQAIIDSYGGLDNTPAYLVRLRPVLKINGDRIVVGQDGLPMGSDYELIMELISPSGTERITNTHIAGNLAVIGITAGKAVQRSESAVQDEKDAERLMYEAVNRYIDRWNQAEDELAALLHLAVARPMPAIVTLGGTIDVTYLLDMPHGFEWKGVFLDADHRSIETVARTQSTENRQKLFTQLSSLQGSILENRVFEDDFEVESISTAKLFQLFSQQPGNSYQPLTINRANVETILPALPFDDDIKEDIANSINQNLIVSIPTAAGYEPSAISYNDWSGIGYIKENPETGESGWMLSGMIAGGMTVVNKDLWINQDKVSVLGQQNTRPPNSDLNSVTRIVRMSDYETGFAGETVAVPCQARAEDASGRPVKNVPVTFRVIAGGGRIQGVDKAGNILADVLSSNSTPSTAYTVKTGSDGIARVKVRLGEKIDDSPYYRQGTSADGTRYWELVGLNMVSMSAQSPASGVLYTDKPFEAYARPGAAAKVEVVSPKTTFYGAPNTLASSAWVKVVDQFGNSISGKNIKFYVEQTFLGQDPGEGARTARLYAKEPECSGISTLDCENAKEYTRDNPLVKFVEYFGAMAYVIIGNTENTRFTVRASAKKDRFEADGRRIDTNELLPEAEMIYQTHAKINPKAEFAMQAYTIYQYDEAGNRTDAGRAGNPFPEKLAVALIYYEEGYQPDVDANGNHYLKGTGVFTTRKVTDGQVEFKPIWGGGLVSTPVVTAGPAPESFYSTGFTFGTTPSLNVVDAIGSAQMAVPTIDPATGLVSNPTRTVSAETLIDVWGVKPDVAPNQLVVINGEGYPVSDTEIHFSVLPADYQYSTKSLYLDFYEKDTLGNESWMGFVQADVSGKFILTQGGTKFNPAYTYSMQLVVDRGRKTEVVSEKVVLQTAILAIEKKDPEFPEVKLRWDDYYPGLGSKTIKLVGSSFLNGTRVTCEVIEPTAATIDNIGTMTVPTCVSSNPQITNGAVKFILTGTDLAPTINNDPSSGVNEIRLRFSLIRETAMPAIEAIYKVRNNSNTTFQEVLDGEAVFSADRDTVVSRSTGTRPTAQGFDYVQELLNQVVPRMRQTYDDTTQQWVSNQYALLQINGMYSDASYIAVLLFKRSFGLVAEASDTYNKIKKDYGLNATDAYNWWWFDKIIEKESLIGKTQRIPGAAETITSTNADTMPNTDPDNMTKDSGLYELYKNVVERFVNSMVAEGDRYRHSISSSSNTSWMSRTGDVVTESESYCYGCKNTYDQFWKSVTRCAPPTQGQVNVNYSGNVNDSNCGFAGSKRYPGLYKGELNTAPQHYAFDYWTGIDCAGFVQRTVMAAKGLNLPGLMCDIPDLLDRDINPTNHLDDGGILARDFFADPPSVSSRVHYLINPNAPANQVTVQGNLRKGDLVRYGNTHISMIYSDTPVCNDNSCTYEIIHASGNQEVCYSRRGLPDDCAFNRKVVTNSINERFKKPTVLKSPTGFGRIKLWD